MDGRPPYSGGRDREAGASEWSGQQSVPNPGQNPVQQQNQIDLNQLPQQTQIDVIDPPPFESLFRTYQGSLPIPSPRSAFRPYRRQSQRIVPHHPTSPPSYMVGGSSQRTSSSCELQICTNSDMSSHQMPPSSSLVNVPPICRWGYQPSVTCNLSRHQRLLIALGADEVGDSSQGPVYQYPDTNSYMTSHQMPSSSSLTLEDEVTWKERREKRARALFEQNMKGWDYLKKRK